MTDTPKIGDNSIAAAELRTLIERAENIESEIAALRDDKKDVFAEGKARGYDVKTMRKMLAARKMDRDAFQEQRALEDSYLFALGLLNG